MLSHLSADVELNMKTVWQMEILVLISNFCLCHIVLILFLKLSHCFIIYSKIVLSFTQIFYKIFAPMLSDSSIEDLFYVGKGNTFTADNLILISAFQSVHFYL